MKSLEKQIAEYNKSKGFSANVSVNMQAAAEQLKMYIDDEIERYYDSYKPKQYERTFDFKNSTAIRNNNGVLEVYFEDSKAYHKRNSEGEWFVPYTANYGWTAKNPTLYHYDYYEGFNFLEKAVEKFNRENTLFTAKIENTDPSGYIKR